MGSDALQRLEAQLAIRELAARYNHAIDEGDVDGWVGMFVPDGTFESTALGVHAGTDALRAFAAGYVATFTGRHCTSDFVIDVDGDEARSRCYLMLVDNSGGPTLALTAVYDDALRRTPDGWRYAHRKVTPDTANHAAETVR